jgi:transcriptional repressor NrdR
MNSTAPVLAERQDGLYHQGAMRCPVCNGEETKVIDSRLSGEGYSIRRRRECASCEYRFSTAEDVEIMELRVIKRDGRGEPYSREKLVAGLRRSFEKLPYTQSDFKTVVGRIERDIQRLRRDEVTSAQIGEIVMEHLKEMDHVAYIRFASVYRSFTDAGDFRDELQRLGGKE